MRLGSRVFAWCVTIVIIVTSRQSMRAEQPAATADDSTAVHFDCQPCGLSAVARKSIWEKLARPIDWEFVETPWPDVLERIEDSHGIQIKIDHNAIEDSGVGYIAEVTMKLHGISLDAGLRRILGPLDLIHLIESETLLITTAEQANSTSSLRVYCCNATAQQVPLVIKALSQAGRIGSSKDKDALSLRDEFKLEPWGTTIVARGTPLQHDAMERQMFKMRQSDSKPTLQGKAAAGSN